MSKTPPAVIAGPFADADLASVLADLDAGNAPIGADLEDAEPTSKRRGRKPGVANKTIHQRLAKAVALAEKARQEAANLKRQAELRTALIVGRTLLAIAENDDGIRAQLLNQLRAADLSARDRAEIAHLFVADTSEAAE